MQNQQNEQKQASWGIIAVIVIAIAGAVIYWLVNSEVAEEIPEQQEITVTTVQPIEESVTPPEPFEAEFVEEEVVEEVGVVEPEIVLPTLEESDNWLLEKLPSLTWRKELIKLMLTDDIIRRFVVFTDNFSQGTLAYEHSPLVKPVTSFSAIETNSPEGNTWQWDESSARRFSLYVDLIRSMDSEMLVQWYVELKPLIDQAYQELGYPDEDFTDVLQTAITKVLDMEIPKSAPILERPSVMYRYQDQDMESQDDADKLLLRLGKENLLVIKSVLLEINEKLARVQ